MCDSYRIQTYNLLIRSQMLYSVELRSQQNRFLMKSDSYRIQTYNLLIRSQMLYSVELRSRYFRFACAKVRHLFVSTKLCKSFLCFFLKKVDFSGGLGSFSVNEMVYSGCIHELGRVRLPCIQVKKRPHLGGEMRSWV